MPGPVLTDRPGVVLQQPAYSLSAPAPITSAGHARPQHSHPSHSSTSHSSSISASAPSSTSAIALAAFGAEAAFGGGSEQATAFPYLFDDLHVGPGVSARPISASPGAVLACSGDFEPPVPHTQPVTATPPGFDGLRIDVRGSRRPASPLSSLPQDAVEHISAPTPGLFCHYSPGTTQTSDGTTQHDMSFTQSLSHPASAPIGLQHAVAGLYPEPFSGLDALINADFEQIAFALGSPQSSHSSCLTRQSCDSDSPAVDPMNISMQSQESLERSASNSKKRSQDWLEPSLNLDSSNAARRAIDDAPRSKSPRANNASSRASRTSSLRSVDNAWHAPKPAARARSRSDVARKHSASEAHREQPTFAGQPPWLGGDLAGEPDDEEGSEPGWVGPGRSFGVADAPTAATPEAFHAHVRSVNPGLEPFMVRRIAQEQVKRHKRLLDFKARHAAAVEHGSCPSGDRCNVLGKGPNYSLSSFARRPSDAPLALFHIVQPEGEPIPDDGLDRSSSIPASFPEGIPLPPVTRLPAIIECPLCFQVKKFMKPSDWTKHVHEDVQPFTCTFANCAEPKSFKRKADWVRHESERHRHLESWRCDVHECWHVCYRKDNFVQHLVREHRLPEPRTKTAKGSKSRDGDAGDEDIVSRLVDKCRVESAKQSVEEPCRFCGVVCDSWKELTVHLAKHMEQVSMPILELAGHAIPRFDALPLRPRRFSADALAHAGPSMSRPRIAVTPSDSSAASPPVVASGMRARPASATPLLQSGPSFLPFDGTGGFLHDPSLSLSPGQEQTRSRSAHELSFLNAAPPGAPGFGLALMAGGDVGDAVTSGMWSEPLLAPDAGMADFGFGGEFAVAERGMFDLLGDGAGAAGAMDLYEAPPGMFGGAMQGQSRPGDGQGQGQGHAQGQQGHEPAWP